MAFGDYIVYVDESGDHGSVSTQYPVFVLAFCIFKKTEYAERVTTALTNFKFRWWGHDAVVLHEREIRKQKPPFDFLVNAERRNLFMSELGGLIESAPFTLIATVLRKDVLEGVRTRENKQKWPVYETAMKFCMERLDFFLTEHKQTSATTPVIFERRGQVEDDALELAFRRLMYSSAYMEMKFAPKTANHCGHQIADLLARPIGNKILYPDRPDRAYEVIERKFRRSGQGRIRGYGLKVFPESHDE